MARFPRTILMPTVLGALAAVALGLPAATAGAQSGAGGSSASEASAREQQEAERRRIATVRRELERAVDRARRRVDEMRESPEYGATEVHALREARVVLERIEPDSPEFIATMARLESMAARQQLRYFEDPQFRGAIKDAAQLHMELMRNDVRVRTMRRPQGWLGVSVTSQTTEVDGAVVSSTGEYPEIVTVEPGSPADQGGVRRGDLLMAVNGRDMRRGSLSFGHLLVPGETIKVRVRRDGRTMELPVKVGEAPRRTFVTVVPSAGGGSGGGSTARAPMGASGRITVRPLPPDAPRPPAAPAPPASHSYEFYTATPMPGVALSSVALLGAELRRMDSDQREALDVDAGVLVVSVGPGTHAHTAGLRSFDVVVRASDTQVRTPDDLRRVIYRVNEAGSNAVELTIVRQRKQRKVVLRW